MRLSYRATTKACFLGYVVQAVVNNLPPLLFLTFQQLYGVSLGQLGLLIVLNFSVQVVVDLLAARYAERIGYRKCMVIAHAVSCLGLFLMGFLTPLMGFSGLLIAMVLNAIGGGLLEVLVSPIVQAIPDGEEKAGALSLLHSFYCWGTMAVIIITTLLHHFLGASHWNVIAYCWIILPLANLVLFCFVPIAPLLKEGESGMKASALFRKPVFWILSLMMVFGAASEQGMSQWASLFAEKGLGVEKRLGDLLGPCLFAFLMGLMRLYYSKKSLSLEKVIAVSSLGMMAGYLLASLSSSPYLALAGCALCGLCTALFWPGTFSLAAIHLPLGGTAMYGLLAFFGDVGCAVGPEVVSLVSVANGDNLKMGLLWGTLFPLCMLILVGILKSQKKD